MCARVCCRREQGLPCCQSWGPRPFSQGITLGENEKEKGLGNSLNFPGTLECQSMVHEQGHANHAGIVLQCICIIITRFTTIHQCWLKAAQKALLLQPSSAAAERVFSLLNNSFGATQASTLQDYLEATIMLQYNKYEHNRAGYWALDHSIIGKKKKG